MAKRLTISLLLLIATLVLASVAFLYAAPDKFSQLLFVAARHHAGLERKEITLPDGLRFVYLEGGKGEPLVLLHGFGANKDNFLQIAPYLTDRYHLIVPDMIGFGESSKPLDADYNPALQVDRLHALLQAIGITGRVNVGGNSMGGLLTLQYGLRHPDNAISLWLLDPAVVFSAPETEYMKTALHAGKNPFEIQGADDLGQIMNKAFVKPPFIPRPILEAQAREFIANKAVQNKVFADTMKSDTEQRVAGMKIPTLIVWGDHDAFVHPAGAEILHKVLPNSRVVIMKDIGHIPQIEAPEQTAADYISFQAALPVTAKQ